MADYEIGQQAPIATQGPSMHDLVVSDLVKRKKFGLSKYGTLLQAGNGRDALHDAYEEVLDLAVYLRQVIEERDHMPAGAGRTTFYPELRQHLINQHGSTVELIASYASSQVVQIHLDEHRLYRQGHEFQPWGEK